MIRLVALVLAASAALPAAAFVRSTDSQTDVCLFWPRRTLHWSLNEKGSADVDIAALEAALSRSFDAWHEVSCTDMAFAYDGRTPRIDAGFDPAKADNLNLLVWREKTCDLAAPLGDPCFQSSDPFACADKYDCWSHGTGIIALTTTNYNRNTGVIVDADIEFNGAPDPSGNEFRFTATVADGPPCVRPTDPNCVATDVQNTATHEIGHFIGLAHEQSVFEATMFPSAPLGETKKRTLDPDDERGLCTIYPAGQPPTTCTPSGHIVVAQQPSKGCGCGSVSGPELGAAGLLVALARRRRSSKSPVISGGSEERPLRS